MWCSWLHAAPGPNSLSPQVRLEGELLTCTTSCDDAVPEGRIGPAGLLLVPCAFAWPDVLSLDVPDFVPTISYAPRGLGNLWQPPAASTLGGIEALMGQTRDRVLRQLDLPLTTGQLADALELSSASTNEHLQVLTASGLTLKHRDGRLVLYRRSDLGEALVSQP